MMRILNPELLLGALAARHPQLSMKIKLSDSLLSDNSGVYELAEGVCVKDCAAVSDYKVDLDISVDTLAGIIFGSHEMGEIFNIPARRPYMSLMLD